MRELRVRRYRVSTPAQPVRRYRRWRGRRDLRPHPGWGRGLDRAEADGSLAAGEELGKADGSHVAARDDDADLAAPGVDLAAEECRDADGAARLDDELHPVEQEHHRVDDLRVADGHDLVDEALVDGERQLARLSRLEPVGDRPRYADLHPLAGREGARRVVAGLRLDADNARSGSERPHYGRAARHQAA